MLNEIEVFRLQMLPSAGVFVYSWKASAVGSPSQYIPQNWRILFLAGGHREIEHQLPDAEQALGLMSSPLQNIMPNRQTFVSPLKFLNAKANLEMFLPQICQ